MQLGPSFSREDLWKGYGNIGLMDSVKLRVNYGTPEARLRSALVELSRLNHETSMRDLSKIIAARTGQLPSESLIDTMCTSLFELLLRLPFQFREECLCSRFKSFYIHYPEYRPEQKWRRYKYCDRELKKSLMRWVHVLRGKRIRTMLYKRKYEELNASLDETLSEQ